jgi:hypothetical protein
MTGSGIAMATFHTCRVEDAKAAKANSNRAEATKEPAQWSFLLQPMRKPADPLDVLCKECGARVGEPCVIIQGARVVLRQEAHATRRNAAKAKARSLL